ncbi:pyrrolo-quinoline quinone, partial [bacterium]|nr:pyrrolo-quinoline quinone [bacterium]
MVRVVVALVLIVLPLAARASDWNQWGGSPIRNNVSPAKNIPAEWTPGDFDAASGA